MSQSITPTQFQRDGIPEAGGLDSDGSDLTITGNDGLVVLEVVNSNLGSTDFTVLATAEVAGQALADTVVPCPPGEVTWAGPFPPVIFNQADDSLLIHAATGLTFRAYRI